jgi:long-chain fatty acid transport protein
LDLRYVDYKNTELFGTRVVSGGLGWDSVFVAALGSRYQVNDRVSVSGGYVYNDNPIPTTGTLFNVQSPLITQNTITVGTTVAVSEALGVSLGYAYGFQNSITGPVREATGVRVKLTTDVHLLTFSMQFKYGRGPGRAVAGGADTCREPATSPADAVAGEGIPGPGV